MKRKILAVLLAGCLLFTAAPAFAVDVVVKNQTLDYSNDQAPVIQKGRTLVPLRSIFEALGATVEWEPKMRLVTCKKGTQVIYLQIDNTTASVNNQGVFLDVPPTILGGRTMVPVRFIAESLGSHVEWSQANQTVYIDSEVPSVQPSIDPIIHFMFDHSFGEISQKFQLVDISNEDYVRLSPVPVGRGDTFPYPSFFKRIADTDTVITFIDRAWAEEKNIPGLIAQDNMNAVNHLLSQYTPQPTATVLTLSGNAEAFILDVPMDFSMSFHQYANTLGFTYGPIEAGTYYDKMLYQKGEPKFFIQSEKSVHSSAPAATLVEPTTKIGIGKY